LVPTTNNPARAKIDFNGDGKSDLLFRDADGTVAVWLMDGLTRAGGAVIGVVPTSWSVLDAHADYNGDGKSDILWRDADGTVAIWQMDGLAIAAGALPGVVPTSWSMQDGNGDYNGDGKSDILFRNTSGELVIWQMDGLAIAAGALVGEMPTSWTMLDGHGDFSGDGKSDLLWRDTSGELAIWQMNGLTKAGSASLGVLSTSWSVQDVDRDVASPASLASMASFAADPGPTLDAGAQAGDGSPDQFRLFRDGAELKVELNGAPLFAAAYDSVAGLTITGSTDDDTLTLDLSGGNPIPGSGLLYDGAGPGDFDVLNITGATGGSLVYTSSGVSSGTIDVGGSLISFINLEPIYDDVVLAERVFVFGPEADTIHVDVGATRTVVSSPFSELVDFVNPTGTVTILTGAGDYNIVVTGNPAYELLIGAAGGGNIRVTSAVAVGAVITGTDGADTIDVGETGDTVTFNVNGAVGSLSGGASVRVYALEGDDTITLHGLTLPVTVDAGPGNDVVDASGVTAASVMLLGGAGDDQLTGGSGNDWLVGGAGDDVLCGGPGNDLFKHVGGKPALFSVDGVNIGLGGASDRHQSDVRLGGGDWVIGERKGKGAGTVAKTSDHKAAHELAGAKAHYSVNWNDTFAGLAAPFGGAGSSRGGGKPNLAEFDHQNSRKNAPR
jgi:hypothetical protein